MSDYAQRFVDALVDAVASSLPVERAEVVGEISAPDAPQPHVSVYLELGPGLFLGTTAGASARPAPLPGEGGFQYFELCAVTDGHSPRVLRVLSHLANFMLSVSAPAFYSDEATKRAWIASGGMPEPRAFLPYQTIRFDEDGERHLLVPRWRFWVPSGPPVEVVEPMPITPAQWGEIEGMSLERRGDWVASLGPRSRGQWNKVLGARA